MKAFKWYIISALVLIGLSMTSYLAQIAIFHRTEDTFFYMLQDLSFVPIQILIVTLIINELLSRREKLLMLKKLNMVIGVFFSEAGTRLLHYFSEFDSSYSEMRGTLIVTGQWNDKDFSRAVQHLKGRDCEVDSSKSDILRLKEFLMDKRQFMLTLMENPNLLEHETFTDLLWAVFHLTEELAARKDLLKAPEVDLKHIAGDIKRAYVLLLTEWLVYMKHLKNDYPALFSFAVRTNPFDPNATPEIK
jgi:hypothetical protein